MPERDLEKAIITGGEGIIASYITFGKRLGHKELDVTNERIVEEVFGRLKPRVVIHLAAATDVERCEKDPEYAWRVNAWGTYLIARACRHHQAKLVYVSTAVVFSGTNSIHRESDIPFPRTVYGRSKYAGELIAADVVPQSLIIRTGWVFGGGPQRDHKFVGKIIGQLKGGSQSLKAVNDHIGSTTYAKDFASRLRSLLEEDRSGIFHIVNAGQASRHDMAQEIASLVKSDVAVEAVSYKTFGLSADRAASEVLGSLLAPLRHWKEALQEYVREEWVKAI